MRFDACRCVVRGFENQENGNKIIAVLENLGFKIAEKFDGQSDSGGGIIESSIVHVNNLETTDEKEVEEAVLAVCPTATVEIEGFVAA